MTKRKNEEESTAANVKRGYPFTVPRHAATEQMYENASAYRVQLFMLIDCRVVSPETHHVRPYCDFRSRFAITYGDM